jgi:alpha-beta hydrolase superfamily lysophospholipase
VSAASIGRGEQVALPAGELAIAATVYAPPVVDPDDARVLVCWPGGSYGRDYWDIQIDGRTGYSFAEHLTAQGFVVVAADELGVGDSGRPADGRSCTYQAQADAADAAVAILRERLAAGTLADALPALTAPKVIGVGQAFYTASEDITLFVLAGSYHCHNFHEGRGALWDRIGAWAGQR